MKGTFAVRIKKGAALDNPELKLLRKDICKFDDDSGETAVYLFCPSCRQRERLKP
jgi:hypothetical protein